MSTWKEIWEKWVNTYIQHKLPFNDWLEKHYNIPVKKLDKLPEKK